MPMSGWRSAWRSLTRTIQCSSCGVLQKPGSRCCNQKCRNDIRGIESPLAGLRFHDLRHHAITELSEGQASDQTIMSIAGHISPRMLTLYSHVRMEAKRTALDALSVRPSTNEGDSQAVMAQSTTQNRPRNPLNSCKSLKRLVDVTGIEPATPCLQSRCSPS